MAGHQLEETALRCAVLLSAVFCENSSRLWLSSLVFRAEGCSALSSGGASVLSLALFPCAVRIRACGEHKGPEDGSVTQRFFYWPCTWRSKI